MGRIQIQNKSQIRQSDQYTAQAIQTLEDGLNRVSDQGNFDPTSTNNAPPSPISGISVVEKNGIHDIQITDNAPAYRAVQYSAFYSQSPDMSNAHRIDLGESQNHRANLGSGKYYWAGANKYSTSDHSPMLYHGGAAPIAVGSGNYSGPEMQAAQGFGGNYRGASGPPIRK